MKTLGGINNNKINQTQNLSKMNIKPTKNKHFHYDLIKNCRKHQLSHKKIARKENIEVRISTHIFIILFMIQSLKKKKTEARNSKSNASSTNTHTSVHVRHH